MNVLFSRLTGCFALATLLAFSTSAFAQIEIDGAPKGNAFSNTGNVGVANVTLDAWLYNVGNAKIDEANIYDRAVVENWGNANIDEVNIYGIGTVYNRDTATIGTVNVDVTGSSNRWTIYNYATINTINADSGLFENYGGAFIDAAYLDGGGSLRNSFDGTVNIANISGKAQLTNWGLVNFLSLRTDGAHESFNAGTIGTTDVYGGALHNDYNGPDWHHNSGSIGIANVRDSGMIQNNGIIDTANVYDGGRVSNVNTNGYSNIGEANVYGGFIINSATANIDVANLFGGTVNNASYIDHLTYTSGSYFGTRDGSIGTLTLAGDARGIDWGFVDLLEFSDNGSGIVGVSAFTGGTVPGFSGITAADANFAYGNVSLNLSGVAGIADDYWASAFFNAFGYDDGFYLYDLVGASAFDGVADLYSFQVDWSDDSFWILKDGVFGSGWSINSATAFVSWDGTIGGGSEVPEPATLAMIGLGIAGLGLARRRMRK
ncbi:MAG: PEP-CTERM sorting domain-containing protein [Planctomycetaceae bacterium]|nr:PEP-CTERM sorting domain-containing protein [Planctomycetaceae bacterium]